MFPSKSNSANSKTHPVVISWTNPNDNHYKQIDKTNIKKEDELQIVTKVIQEENLHIVEGIGYYTRYDVPAVENSTNSKKRSREEIEDENLNNKKIKSEPKDNLNLKIQEIHQKYNENSDDEEEGRLIIKEEEELIIIEEQINIKEEKIEPKSKSSAPQSPASFYSSDDGSSSQSTSSHTCQICQKSFKRKIDLIHHKNIHIEAKYECTKCKQKFKSLGYFKKHECNICKICERSFSSKQQLKVHQRLSHSEGLKIALFQCDLCGKEFKYRHGVLYHMQVEHIKGPKKEYNCDVCGKIFDMKEKVRLHLKHHSGFTDCHLCGKRVKTINMGHHNRYVHTKERKFKCQLCGTSFKTRECLKSHTRTHEKGFSCKECDKKFPSQYLLNEHQILHKNPDELTCKECNKTFAQKYCLKAHMKLHEKGHNFEKFRCTVCSYSTESQDNLKKHQLKHKRKEENELLTKDWIPCKKCSMKLKNKLKLATHYWKKHKMNVPE
ncbi:hypothetical protein PVAND_016953 [Polypedilum vanderplanki]|uniref:C2H2-type domain-containing protein n=1 Tax=Polypedilum vanderplanki TaxID=319348 RepID=A0A9J6BGS1_POLVA|nr:hypothetical protein PVAND_016953 [Polypedilum vanderplanki]